jgi:hypothetical protein
MTRFNLILACIVFAVVPQPVIASAGRYSISAEQIAVAVGRMGVRVSPRQITILADVVATTPAPVLQVRSLERLDADRFMVRLECMNEENCLPFMAGIQVDKNEATQLASISSRGYLQSGAIPEPAQQPEPGSVVIRSGSSAVLQLEGPHIHIRIPVICLQNGAAGQTIRATDKDHRRIYAAQVIDFGILRGRL